jgi:hypothetical protein
MRSFWFRDRNEIRVFLVLLAVLAFFLSFGPGRTQGARVIAHAHALLYEGRNAIDTCHWNTIDKLHYRDHYYTSGGPGMGYLAVPVLALFDGLYHFVPAKVAGPLNEKMRRQLEEKSRPVIQEGSVSFDPAVNRVDLLRLHAAIWFLEFFIVLLTAAGGVMFYRLLLLFELSPAIASHAAVFFGLGTTLFFYSRVPYALTPNALLLLLAFYLITLTGRQMASGKPIERTRMLVAGLALGLGVAIHYIQIIGAVLIFLYAWQQLGWRRAWWVALGGVPMGALIMLYHYACFDDPFVYPYRYAIPILAVENQQEVIKIVGPTWQRFLAIVFGLRRGLFVYNPVLLFLLMLMVKESMLRKRLVAFVSLVVGMLLGYLFFQASTPLVDSLWGIGPRYASVVVPFLMLGVVFVATRAQRRVFYGLAWLSLLLNVLMVQRDIESQHYAFPLGDALAAFLQGGCTSSLLQTVLPLAGVSSPRASGVIGAAAFAGLALLVLALWRTFEERRPREVEACAANVKK